jgi:two-component system CheB/CheR fusion protein
MDGVLLVALTGWGQEEDRRRSKEAGFDFHLVKPADPEQLTTALAAARLPGGTGVTWSGSVPTAVSPCSSGE